MVLGRSGTGQSGMRGNIEARYSFLVCLFGDLPIIELNGEQVMTIAILALCVSSSSIE